MNDTMQSGVVFSDVTPGSLQQLSTLLLERLANTQLPEMGGMLRLHGHWTDPGRPSGKIYYGAKVVDDGGAQVKVEILASLVSSRGIVPGQNVVVTGRLAVRTSNYGIELRLAGTDIQLGDQEEAATSDVSAQGRMTLDRLRAIPVEHVPFPDRDSVSVTLIQSNSAGAQVVNDCMAEIEQVSSAVTVRHVQINMLDPVAIATAIRDANACDIVAVIRGGGPSQDFEVFDDPRVVVALAGQHVHRVVGLGHSGNRTLLDLMADHSSNTPAQLGGYIRERVQQRQHVQSDASRDLRLANERLVALEKECKVAQSQLETASDLLSKAAGGFPVWAVAAAFIAGAALVWVFR